MYKRQVAGGTDVRIDDAERREWTDDNVCMEKMCIRDSGISFQYGLPERCCF